MSLSSLTIGDPEGTNYPAFADIHQCGIAHFSINVEASGTGSQTWLLDGAPPSYVCTTLISAHLNII